MAQRKSNAELVIAGPGAGKTHNMVNAIIDALPHLSPCRYLAVITYTNSATNNIRSRLSKQITLPENLFIGTIHSFLNRFVVIPFGSYGDSSLGAEKLFLQCGTNDVVEKVKKMSGKKMDYKDTAVLKSRVKDKLTKQGYITFDHTLSIAKTCIKNKEICRILSNRLQYLFVDEFQDSSNDIYEIIEALRKSDRTKVYCVGDPEQYIQSFDSTIKNFKNIPILKAAGSTGYHVSINHDNHRSNASIVNFLNHFNGRMFGDVKFMQNAIPKDDNGVVNASESANILFLSSDHIVKPIIEAFNIVCDKIAIPSHERCIMAKKNSVIRRVATVLNNHFMNPKKNANIAPMRAIEETLLTTLQMKQKDFCEHYQTDLNGLRKHAIKIFKAIHSGRIHNENTFGQFVRDELQLVLKDGLPVKVENLKFDFNGHADSGAMTVANIHTMKGLEAQAVLAIAETEEELLLWLLTDQEEREKKRDNDMTDYPRLGYVAFSRAEQLLCISCLEQISTSTSTTIKALGIKIL